MGLSVSSHRTRYFCTEVLYHEYAPCSEKEQNGHNLQLCFSYSYINKTRICGLNMQSFLLVICFPEGMDVNRKCKLLIVQTTLALKNSQHHKGIVVKIIPTRCNNCGLFIANAFTLHVSGDSPTHHQEYMCCIWP